MKLVFRKDKDAQISVRQTVDGKEADFMYVDLVKSLAKTGQLENPEIGEGFTESERESISRMIALLNDEVVPKSSAD